MSVVMINDVMLPDDRPLTVDDLQLLPDDGLRYELVYGVLEVSAAPFGPHERALRRLEYLLQAVMPAGFELMGNQGVNLHGDVTRHRIPDTSIIRAGEFEEKYQTRPAVLVVEVASASTALLDRNVKKPEYEDFGIESYWIVAPDKDRPSITAYELCDGNYIEAAHVEGDEVFRTDRPYPFEARPRQLVMEGQWR